MASYNKHNNWVEDMQESANVGTDQFVLALTPAANPPVAGNATLSALTVISYTNLSSRNLSTTTSAQSGGTFTFLTADLVLTASGGAVATFRYVDMYDDTPTSPADPLVAWWDYGGNVTLADTETFTFDTTTSVYTVT